MIATVQIAPVERWCDTGKTEALLSKRVRNQAGHFVEIETESMQQDTTPPFCGGRQWVITEKSQRALNEQGVLLTKPEVSRMVICEHRLEMD